MISFEADYTRATPLISCGLAERTQYGQPFPGGKPVDARYEIEKIGYWEAAAKRLAWEVLLAKLSGALKKDGKPSPHVITPSFKYKLRITTYARHNIYVQYWEVCYDDCTGEELSRKALMPGIVGKTEEIIINQKEETEYLQ